MVKYYNLARYNIIYIYISMSYLNVSSGKTGKHNFFVTFCVSGHFWGKPGKAALNGRSGAQNFRQVRGLAVGRVSLDDVQLRGC